MTAILNTVIGALCLSAIYAFFKSRWLYVIVPKLYLNTPISNGYIVSLSIYNAGLMTEEDVAISFRPTCKFELLATSKSTLNVAGNILTVSKLSRLEMITVLLLFEERTFDASDIESIESKAAKGKVVESKEKATALWQHLIALPFLIAFMFLPFVIGTYIGSEMETSFPTYIVDNFDLIQSTKQLSGFSTVGKEWYSVGKLKGSLNNAQLLIQVEEIVRRGDILNIKLNVINQTAYPLSVDASFDSSAGQGPLDYGSTRVNKFSLAHAEKKSIMVKTYLPETTSAKIVQGRFTFATMDGDDLTVVETIGFK